MLNDRKCFICRKELEENSEKFMMSINQTKLGLVCSTCKEYLDNRKESENAKSFHKS